MSEQLTAEELALLTPAESTIAECEGIPESESEFPYLDAEGGGMWFAYDPLS